MRVGQEIRRFGSDGYAVGGDNMDRIAIRRLVADVIEHFGRLDHPGQQCRRRPSSLGLHVMALVVLPRRRHPRPTQPPRHHQGQGQAPTGRSPRAQATRLSPLRAPDDPRPARSMKEEVAQLGERYALRRAHRHYRCFSCNRRGADACEGNSVRADRLDRAVVDVLVDVGLKPERLR